MRSLRRIALALICIGGMCAASGQDLALKDLFRAKALRANKHEEELGRDVLHRTWDLSAPDRANFTMFNADCKGLAVTPDKTIRFSAAAPKVTIGWGNYAGKQPVKDRIHLWPTELSNGFYIEIKAKQSIAGESTWTLHLWRGGQRDSGRRRGPKPVTVKLKGDKLQTLRFGRLGGAIRADGFDLEIAGPKGNVIEIASLRFVRDIHDGYYRKTFDLRDAKVWSAIVDVCKWGAFYVNGREVNIENSIMRRPGGGGGMYQTVPVDIAPYLKPGRNSIALYGKRVGYTTFMYLQGQVVLATGDVVRLDTDDSWRWSPAAAKGWQTTDFDDSAWKPAKTRGLWYYYMKNTLPAYDGRLVIESSTDRKLFFDAAKPVKLRVRVPVGLQSRKPALLWAIQRCDYDGEHDQAKGRVDAFSVSGDSLVFEVDAGRLAQSVYAIALTLEAGGKVIESRPREPFVVMGRIPMKEVEGLTYEDGMKLKLEDTIDFTNPADPHPWVECYKDSARAPGQKVTKPRIVHKHGMTYRETGPGRGSFFSYKFQFKHPGDFYVMVLDYPNDAERWIGVSCSTSVPMIWTNTKAGPSIWTGDKYPLTNTMQEHRWIFRADYGPHTIDIIVMQQGSPAAASRLRIYHIDELPALKIRGANQRRLGILTERTTLTTSFAKTFGLDVHNTRGASQAEKAPEKTKPMLERIETLVRNLDACDHYVRYMRFTGQNLHVMGCFQYSENNTPFSPEPLSHTSRVPRDIRDTAIRLFGFNGIDVYASVEYAGSQAMVREFPITDSQVAAGADTARLVSRDGKQKGGIVGGYYGCWNFAHPRVQQHMYHVAADILEKFKDRPNFRGINWTAYMTEQWIPSFGQERGKDAFYYSYDDATIRLFEKDTGIRVPVDAKDPRRFEKRYIYLTSDAIKPKWIAWRCNKVHQFYLGLRDQVRKVRPDLDAVVSLYFNVPHARAWSLAKVDGRPEPLRTFMREWGYDPTLYAKDKGLWFVRWAHATLKYEPLRHAPAYAAGWRQNVDPEFINLFQRPDCRAVMFMHHWDENTYVVPGAKKIKVDYRYRYVLKMPDGSEWPSPFNRGRLHAQPNMDFAREAFTQAMIASDPEQVRFGFMDVNLMVGNEQPLREFARVFRALPREQFQPALGTGFETNIAIRDLKTKDAYYFYVANPGTWPIEGEVKLTGGGNVVEIASGKTVGKGRVSVKLEPFGLAAFRVDSPDARVASWSNKPVADAYLAHMRGLVQSAAQLLGNKRARATLLPDELAFMRKAVAKAKAALDKGQDALAWNTVTNWRFWVLLHEYLEKGAKLATGSAPHARTDPTALPKVQAAIVEAAPKLDGRLDDAVWKRAPKADGFVTNQGRPSMVSTTVQLACDAENLYVGVDCADREPSKIRKTAKGEKTVFSSADDAFGMFLQPDPQMPHYYQLAFTAGGVKFDQQVIGGARDYAYAPAWTVAVHEGKAGWSAEARIPLKAIGAACKPGQTWRGNFFRQFRQRAMPNSYWSLVARDAHDTSRFGKIEFEKR